MAFCFLFCLWITQVLMSSILRLKQKNWNLSYSGVYKKVMHRSIWLKNYSCHIHTIAKNKILKLESNFYLTVCVLLHLFSVSSLWLITTNTCFYFVTNLKEWKLLRHCNGTVMINSALFESFLDVLLHWNHTFGRDCCKPPMFTQCIFMYNVG